MAQTSNYKLYVTDNDQEKFLTWRENMASTTDSNMTKIDNILGEHASKIENIQNQAEDILARIDTLALKTKSIDCNLPTESWVGESAPFTQELFVEGVTADSNGMIYVSQSASFEQRELARLSILGITAQNTNSLTIVADGEDKPTADIPVTILIFG